MTVPFSLPREEVDEARRAREDSWLERITKETDRQVKEGLQSINRYVEQSPLARVLAEGGLRTPTLDDLTPEWVRQAAEAEKPRPVQTPSGTPQAMPTSRQMPSVTIEDGRQTQQPGLRPGESVGIISYGQGPQQQETLGDIVEGDPEGFFRTAGAYARQVERETGVPAALSLAIAANETGYGQRRYMAGKWNFHGIQAQPGEPGSVPYRDWRPGAGGQQEFYNAAQRSFGSPLDGFRGFARFLLDNPRYAPALERYWQSGDVDRLAADIHAAGYAEDPEYARKITSIMRGIPVQTAGGTTDTRGVPLTGQQQPQAPRAPVPTADQPEGQTWAAGSWTPNQYEASKAEGLDDETAWAVCGPAAAIAFARRTGRNPTMQEALGLARQVGWTADAGMAGPGSQQQLLERMGVASRLVNGAPDWQAVAADVQRGNQVIVSTPGHYFVAERYDPETGTFDFGQSASILKAAKGRRWFRPDEIESLGMGAPRASLYLDNPNSPTPSAVAGRSDPTMQRAPLNAGAASPSAPAAPSQEPSPATPPAGDGSDPLDAQRASEWQRGSLLSQQRPDEMNPEIGIGESTRPGRYIRDGDMGYPTDWRGPGSMPYDVTDDEGLNRSEPSDRPFAPPGPAWTMPGLSVPPDAMYRQPLEEGGSSNPYVEDPSEFGQWSAPPRPPSSFDPNEGGTRVPAQPRMADDPGGAQHAIADSQSTPPRYDPRLVDEGTGARELASQPSVSPSPMKPLYDLAGNVIGYVQAGSETGRRYMDERARQNSREEIERRAQGAGLYVPGASPPDPGGTWYPVGQGPDSSDYDAPPSQGLPNGGRIQPGAGPAALDSGGSVFAAEDSMSTLPSEAYDRPPSAGLPDDGLIQPGSPYAPDAMGEPPATRFEGPTQTQQTSKPVWDTAGALIGYVQEGAGNLASAAQRDLGRMGSSLSQGVLGPSSPEIRAEANRGMQEAIRSVGEPVDRALASGAETVERTIGAPAGTVRQAFEDASGVLGPGAPVLGMARSAPGSWGQALGAAGAARPAPTVARAIADAVPEAVETVAPVAEEVVERAALDPRWATVAKRVAKYVKGDQDEADRLVGEFQRLINSGASAGDIADFWRDVEGRAGIKPSELFALFRRFNMLSGPRTFEVNALSGALNLAYEVVTGAVGTAARGRLGEAAAEAAAPLKSAGRAFGKLVETMREGVTTEQAMRGDIPQTLSSRTDNPLAKGALTVMEIPDRLNSAVDQFFRTLTEDWAATRLAHQQARAAGLRPGSDKWAEAVAKNVDAIRADPSKYPAIKEMADRVTFAEEPGGLVKWLEDGKRRYPNLVGVIAPFIRTPANIASRAVDMSPLGIVRTGVEASTGLGRGTRQLPERVRDNVIGLAGTMWAYNLAEQGLLTGAGPDDPEKLAMLRATGWQPYSVKLGDEYWSYANFAPFSLMLSAGAAASEARKYAKPGKTDALSVLTDGAARTGKVVTNMTVLAGLGSIVKSIEDPDRYGGAWLSQTLQQLIPAGSFINTIGQAMDPNIRRAERDTFANQVGGSLLARIPPNPITPDRMDVPAAQDPVGRPVPNEQTGLGALNPFRPTTERDDPTIRAFLDAGVDIGAPKRELTIRPGTAPVELSPAEQRRWNELRGAQLILVAPKVAEAQSYRAADRMGREVVLKRLLNNANEAADRQLMGEIGNVELRRRMAEAAAKKRSGQ